MTNAVGNRVAVFRRKIPLLRAAIFLGLLFAVATALAIIVTRRPMNEVVGYLFAYLASWGLAVACLWLIPWVEKVTLFEGGVRGPARGFGVRTLAWSDISSAVRMPLWARSLGVGFDAALFLETTAGRGIVITEPLADMQLFSEHVRRLAGDEHPLARLLAHR